MPHWLVTVGLGPVLLLQGKYARYRTPRLPEPPGERSGTRGQGEPLRLLLLGDSGAAGVGAGHQNEALLGQIIHRLESRHQIAWRLHAKTGATTASTLRGLGRIKGGHFDLVVTSLGVNDLTSGLSEETWLAHFAQLRSTLRQSFGAPHIIVSGLPPIDMFPALPQPLRWYLGQRAQQFSQALQADVEHEHNCTFLDLNFTRAARTMASDGYHPGPEVYSLWGAEVAALVGNKVGNQIVSR